MEDPLDQLSILTCKNLIEKMNVESQDNTTSDGPATQKAIRVCSDLENACSWGHKSDRVASSTGSC